MDKKDIPSKRFKKKVGSTSHEKPIQTNYISLEEAAKYIPRFDGYNMIVSIFFNECKRALNLIRPRDVEPLRNLIFSKITGIGTFLYSDTNDINEFLDKIYLRYKNVDSDVYMYKVDYKTLNNYIDRDVTEELEYLKNERCFAKNKKINAHVRTLLLHSCHYCKIDGHTEENHCCIFLKTTKKFKMLESNRLSRHLFLNKLYLRELGVVEPKYQRILKE